MITSNNSRNGNLISKFIKYTFMNLITCSYITNGHLKFENFLIYPPTSFQVLLGISA